VLILPFNINFNKLPNLQKYKDRFMKLERLNGRHFLVYYKNKSDSKHSGQILLEQAQIELDERNKKNWRVITGL